MTHHSSVPGLHNHIFPCSLVPDLLSHLLWPSNPSLCVLSIYSCDIHASHLLWPVRLFSGAESCSGPVQDRWKTRVGLVGDRTAGQSFEVQSQSRSWSWTFWENGRLARTDPDRSWLTLDYLTYVYICGLQDDKMAVQWCDTDSHLWHVTQFSMVEVWNINWWCQLKWVLITWNTQWDANMVVQLIFRVSSKSV